VVFSFLFSLIYIQNFELQLFLTYPLFFIILTIPLRGPLGKAMIAAISIVVIIFSLTNRAGILRILISYCIVAAYYLMQTVRINRKLIRVLIFAVLILPFISLYLGIKGQNIFEIVLGDNDTPYSQEDPLADTRTFLYYEVLQDLKFNKALMFGKGLNAGYDSPSFQTYNRNIVEVGFLQILMKIGILGFLIYLWIILSAVYKALSNSQNQFIKCLGILLASYIIMLFIENQVAYNLLNIIVWIVIGMCHSDKLRRLNDKEIRSLLLYDKLT
jgi:hypothetical protein